MQCFLCHHKYCAHYLKAEAVQRRPEPFILISNFETADYGVVLQKKEKKDKRKHCVTPRGRAVNKDGFVK